MDGRRDRFPLCSKRLHPKSDENLISLLYLMNFKTFLIGVLYSGVVFRCCIQVTLTDLEIQDSPEAVLF